MNLFDKTCPNHYVAELFGTFLLVLAGCGAIVVNDLYSGLLGHGGVSLSFGLVVMVVIYALGNISGAHLNPAVTLGFYAAGRFPLARVLPFVLSQCLGATLAAVLLKLAFAQHPSMGSTLPTVTILNAFVIEVLLSYILMLVILNVSTRYMEKGIMAGVAIGATVGLEALIGGPLTGASMNPARSLGPALVSNNLNILWLYLIAPVVGTLLAAPTCKLIQGSECCRSPKDSCEST